MHDKARPTHVTVFEMYAGKQAYEAHFQKYKTGALKMVKSFQLVEIPLHWVQKREITR